MVPATAVPSDEPRFDTQRDSPEISLCWSSGKADWTTFTDGVSMTPSPNPMSRSPGANAHSSGECFTISSRKTTPSDRGHETRDRISVRCWKRLARAPAASDDTRMPTVAAVKITPVLMAL